MSSVLPGSTDKMFGSVASQVSGFTGQWLHRSVALQVSGVTGQWRYRSVALRVSGVTGHCGRLHIFISCFSVFMILDLLACDAVLLGRSSLTLRKIVVPSSSGTQGPNDPRTQLHNPEHPTPQ